VSSGVEEDNVQFQATPIALDPNEKDVVRGYRMLNAAVKQLQELCVALRNRVIELENKVNN